MALLSDRRLLHPANTLAKAQIVRKLQTDYGNHYVQRLVNRIAERRGETAQPSRESGPSEDVYQQAIQRNLDYITGSPASDRPQEAPPLQAKLTVGPAGDRYEKEADQVAKKVVRMTEPPVQRVEDREEEIQHEEIQMKPARPQVGPEGGHVDTDIEKDIQRARGKGQSLPNEVRSTMEHAFESDFSGVRVHNDTQSTALNENLSARAFTTGQDIFIKQGEYSPDSTQGRELIAHELTHVVQQNGPTIRRDDDEEETSGLLALVDRGAEKLDEFSDKVSEKLDAKVNQGLSWAKKPLVIWWEKFKSKHPWLGNFLEGLGGLVVNPIKLRWAGLKLIAHITKFVLTSTLSSILRTPGKVLDAIYALVSGKSFKEVNLFKDTRNWDEDWKKTSERPTEEVNKLQWASLSTEIIGIWGNNIRDWTSWLSMITGLLSLIPPAAGLLVVSGISGAISLLARPIASSATVLSGIFNALLALVGSKEEKEQAKEQGARVGKRLLGDVVGAAAMGAAAGAKNIAGGSDLSYGEEVQKGASVTESLGMKEAAESLGDKGIDLENWQAPGSEALKQGVGAAGRGVGGKVAIKTKGLTEETFSKKKELKVQGAAVYDSLMKYVSDLHGMLKSILETVTSGFKVVGEVLGGLVQLFAKILDIVSRGKLKLGGQSLFEAASEWWPKIRENWLDASLNWVRDKLDKLDDFIEGLRQNNPFLKEIAIDQVKYVSEEEDED